MKEENYEAVLDRDHLVRVFYWMGFDARAGTGGDLRIPHADLGGELVVVELEFVEWVGVGRRC